jgi:hypothetical protein
VQVGACGGAQTTRLVGVSSALPERSESSRPVAPPPPWPDFATAQAWPEAAPASVARAHFRDGTLVHVRVEPPGLDAYRKLAVDSPMPADARVVAWHETRSGQLRGGYLLEKRQGAWSAREIDNAGGLVSSDPSLCLRCHQMAPTDHLFGAPPVAVIPAAPEVPESIQPAAR